MSQSFTDHELRRDLRGQTRRIQDAELKIRLLRDQLDRSLFNYHKNEGVAVGRLALAAGLSRETAYKSIKRVLADIDAEGTRAGING
jgi:hypothetical protein